MLEFLDHGQYFVSAIPSRFDVPPARVRLVYAIKGRVMVALHEVWDAALRQHAIHQLRLNLVVQNRYLFEFVHKMLLKFRATTACVPPAVQRTQSIIAHSAGYFLP